MSTNNRADRLLALARTLFLERGQGFSLDELAGLARVSKRTVYELFPSKQELLEQILLSFAGEIDRGYELACAEPSGDFAAWLRGILTAAAGKYDPVLIMRLREVERSHPGLWQTCSQWSADGWDRVAGLICQKAHAAGYQAPAADVLELLLTGFHRELASQGFRGRSGKTADRLLLELADLLLAGLRGPGGNRPA